MYKTHATKVQSYAQRSADNMAWVVIMVICSIRMNWLTVGFQLIDIKNLKSREDFYGKLGENRGIVDSIIEDVLEYLESSGYKIKNEFE